MNTPQSHPTDEPTPEHEFNTEETYDAVLVIVFLLLVLPSCEVQQEFVAPHLRALDLLPAAGERPEGVLVYVGLLLLIYLAYLGVRALWARKRTFQVVKALVMVPVGGLVLWGVGFLVAVLFLFALMIPLHGTPVQRHRGTAAFVLILLLSHAFAGWWGGWRAGRWGALCGAVAGLAGLTHITIRLWEVSDIGARTALWGLAGLAGLAALGVAALTGHLGAARFRRTQHYIKYGKRGTPQPEAPQVPDEG
ncbi:MAG: hypothetical protein ACYS8K_08315 [Planctomycetota bacterium]